MSLREKMNRNPRQTAMIAGGVAALCVGFLLWQTLGAGGGSSAERPVQAFYTADDGKTWFPADADQFSPITHEGKPAYRVHVFKCGDSGKPFAGYLERLSDAMRKRADELKAKHANDPTSPELDAIASAIEVKKPGDPKWVRAGLAAANTVTAPKCPAGDSGTVTEVLP
jgi:hypothetical protein